MQYEEYKIEEQEEYNNKVKKSTRLKNKEHKIKEQQEKHNNKA